MATEPNLTEEQTAGNLDWIADSSMRGPRSIHPCQWEIESDEGSPDWDDISSIDSLTLVFLTGHTLSTIIKASSLYDDPVTTTYGGPVEASSTSSSAHMPAKTPSSNKPDREADFTISYEPIPSSSSDVARTTTHEVVVTVIVTPTTTITVPPEPDIDNSIKWKASPSTAVTEVGEPSTMRWISSSRTIEDRSTWDFNTLITSTITNEPANEPSGAATPTIPEESGEDTPQEESNADSFAITHSVIFSIVFGAAMAIAII